MNDVIEITSYLNKNHQVIDIGQIEDYDFSQISEINLGKISFKNFPDGRIIKLIDTDFEHPFIINNKSELLINEEYLKKNKEKVLDLISIIISKIKKNKIMFSSEFLNDKVIDSICNNINIENVDILNFSLTIDIYEKFKNFGKKIGSSSVCEELEDIFDDTIIYNLNKKILCGYNYKDLVSRKSINIDGDLSDKELENLKYLNDEAVINISGNLNDLNRLINKLEYLNKNNLVRFNALDKGNLNELVFNDSFTYENLEINVNIDSYINIKDFLKYEKLLYSMIKDAMNLSPFEKYIYAYNIVKKFKIYKETESGHKLESRNLYQILENDYIVCVGFSEFFGNLLTKLGINNVGLSVKVDESYDDVKSSETNFDDVKSVELGGHARRYVYLKDDKYGIDGYFVADPTWDNDLEQDYYNHLIMTNKEVVNARRYLSLSYDDIFNVDNLEEYIIKIKRIMDKGNEIEFRNQVKFMLETIKGLDKSFYKVLCSKYSYVDDILNNNVSNNLNNLLYDMGLYIVGKVNKNVSGKTIFDGVREVYKHSYGYSEEDLDFVLNTVREYNKKRHDRTFPARYRINKDDTKEIIYNDNKFDFDMYHFKKM